MSSTTTPSSPSGSSLQVDYAFSWRWLIGGLFSAGIVAAVVWGIYTYQMSKLPNSILDVADALLAEGKTEEAENILRSFSDANPNDERIWKKRTEVSDRMLAERGALPGVLAQGLELYRKLKGKVSEADSLPYLKKIMTLEWERRNVDGAMQEAREILEKSVQHPDWSDLYPAWRILLLGSFQRLQTRDYFVASSGNVKLPESMDAFFAQVYEMKPTDIEVAVCYADFLRQGDNMVYSRSASDRFRAMTPADRNAKADTIVNDMVLRNSDQPQAWLTRYRYRAQYNLIDPNSTGLDADIVKALSLDPKNIDALTLAGLAYLFQAYQATDPATVADLRKNAEAQFRTIMEIQPENEVSYLYLGDIALRDNDTKKAIELWTTGLQAMKPQVSTELALRLIFLYIAEKRIDDATAEVERLQLYYNERRPYVTLADSVQFTRVINLLKANVLNAEGAQLMATSEAARTSGDRDAMMNAYKEAQAKFREAMVLCQGQLQHFGSTPQDQVVLRQRAVSRLIGESLMLLGRLKADDSRWDEAMIYFRMAMGFPGLRERALVSAARVYLQQDLLPEANQMLADAVAANPDDVALRFQYAQSLYRAEMMKPAQQRQFAALQAELDFMQQESVRAKLRQPWLLDVLVIVVPYARDSSSSDPAQVLAAQQKAIAGFRELETKTYTIPPDTTTDPAATAKDVVASDDPVFLSLLAAFYSTVLEVHDFERVLSKMRSLTDGEFLYYNELVRDAMRRNDTDGVRAVIETAVVSPNLSPSQQQVFASMGERLMSSGEGLTEDALYTKLVTAYNANPDSFRPQPLFQMAIMAVDRRDWKAVSAYQDRLATLEDRSIGTLWRAIAILRALSETDPPALEEAKKIQQELVELRPDWDLTHILAAKIEEAGTPPEERLSAAPRIIEHLKQAIRLGNRTPAVWEQLLQLLQRTNRSEEREEFLRTAGVRGVTLNVAQGEFPEPYQRMTVEASQAIGREDFAEANSIARSCLERAEGVKERVELLFDLNLYFGKMFLDVNQTDFAQPYLTATAGRGGIFVYPLAIRLVKAGKTDEAFRVLLDETDRVPTSLGDMIPIILSLLTQATPSEAIQSEVDALMLRIEQGERDVLVGTLEPSTESQTIDLGSRRVNAFSIRFPGATSLPPADAILIAPPSVVSPFEEMAPPRIPDAKP
ncbi:MAG: tetratricopeptide repeat protein [Thermoguttaceae bacterium]